MFPLPACDRTSQGDRLSGETNGALLYRDILTRTRYMHIRTCVRGWQGSGPDSAPAKSRSLSLSLSPFLSFHLSPSFRFSFPSFFPLLSSLLLSPSLFPRPRQRVTLLLFRRYLDWLAFQRTTLFPATTEIPVAVVSPTRKLLSRRAVIRDGFETWFPRIPGQLASDEYYVLTKKSFRGNVIRIRGGRRGR